MTPRARCAPLLALHEGVNSDNLQAMKAIMPEPEIVTRKGKPVSVITPH
jgi:hypothetical protein